MLDIRALLTYFMRYMNELTVTQQREGPALASDVRLAVSAILKGQASSGAFVASPDFASYQFCWLRDSSFIAYALDRAGEHGASGHYHRWAAKVIWSIRDRLAETVERHRAGATLQPARTPPARGLAKPRVRLPARNNVGGG